VVDHSRFAQAALLLIDSSGRYRLSGTAGMDTATAMALGRLAARISIAGFLIKGSAPSAVEQSQTLVFNLEPLLAPGDDLKILGLTSLLAVPLTGRSGTEGALLLNDLRQPQGKAPLPLRPDDLLPLEMLGARLQASRSRTMMFEKLVDSEKYAGLGQLASNVTLQLNNPLTSILGFASLLEDASGLNPQDRKGVESILSEARRMKSSLESLTRIFSAPLHRVAREHSPVAAQGPVPHPEFAPGGTALCAVCHGGSRKPGPILQPGRSQSRPA
jgi:signal transduction histidine kinase